MGVYLCYLMNKKIRVRFAPSPTGGLHLGGVRTVLYNYLFAKKHDGDFILRIEDTDQARYVAGAEQYIYDCLKWCGLEPDESPIHEGEYGPYRQSERKELYRQYAEQLIKNNYAYYAFDTTEELGKMRHDFKTEQNPSPQYDHSIRMKMQNSLTLSSNEVIQLLNAGTNHVIRIKMPEHENISFTDMIRGEVHFETSLVDDKVLLKADGMPTYHLAVVVDDYLMKITHAFRGEEWLPSAPVHILLWKYLFGIENMPQWAHFPLILGPNGKLSKRDSAKYGFPVFAMNWTDPKTGELIEGFKEKGFLPEAFINLLALLGWNDGTEQEIFTKEELIEKFSIERVHSGGAKFDYEKAKWFQHKWLSIIFASFQPTNQPYSIKQRNDPYHGEFTVEPLRNEQSMSKVSSLLFEIKKIFKEKGIDIKNTDEVKFEKVVALIKDRCTLLTDFYDQSHFFFKAPEEYDLNAVKPKWNDEKKKYFETLVDELQAMSIWESAFVEDGFKKLAAIHKIKPGELQLPFRIMLVGGKFGPPVFEIAEILGKQETISRIKKALTIF
jgi:glutamyl-tRNA synthetase